MSELCSLNAAVGSDSGRGRDLEELAFLRDCNDAVKAHPRAMLYDISGMLRHVLKPNLHKI